MWRRAALAALCCGVACFGWPVVWPGYARDVAGPHCSAPSGRDWRFAGVSDVMASKIGLIYYSPVKDVLILKTNAKSDQDDIRIGSAFGQEPLQQDASNQRAVRMFAADRYANAKMIAPVWPHVALERRSITTNCEILDRRSPDKISSWRLAGVFGVDGHQWLKIRDIETTQRTGKRKKDDLDFADINIGFDLRLADPPSFSYLTVAAETIFDPETDSRESENSSEGRRPERIEADGILWDPKSAMVTGMIAFACGGLIGLGIVIWTAKR